MSDYEMQQFIRLFEEMLNKFDMSIADDIFSSNFKAHFPLMPQLDRSGFKSYMMGFYDAFPNLMMNIEDWIPTKDRLVLRMIYSGKQKGDFMGIPASGRAIKLPAICIFRIENGKAVENWTEMDFLGAISQISGGGSSLPDGGCD